MEAINEHCQLQELELIPQNPAHLSLQLPYSANIEEKDLDVIAASSALEPQELLYWMLCLFQLQR